MVSFRAGGLFITAPILSARPLPRRIKAGMAILLGIMLVPLASQADLPEITSIWTLALLAAKESLVGVIIGFFLSLVFIGIRMAGSIIGFQSGLAMANIMERENSQQVSMVSEFWIVMGTLIFLAIGGHHAVISGFADSFRVLPIGTVSFSGPAGEMLLRFTSYAFVIAIKISAPIMITLFLVSVTLGVLARTVPQMNIFIVGIPLKIGISFLVMAASLPIFRVIIFSTVQYLDSEVLTIIQGLGTA
jgi:flagellar biosynthetic protein FliR